MTKPETHHTRSGRILTDEEIDALATEIAETDYDVEALKTRQEKPHFKATHKSGPLV